jgi:hypothetical protein
MILATECFGLYCDSSFVFRLWYLPSGGGDIADNTDNYAHGSNPGQNEWVLILTGGESRVKRVPNKQTAQRCGGEPVFYQ